MVSPLKAGATDLVNAVGRVANPAVQGAATTINRATTLPGAPTPPGIPPLPPAESQPTSKPARKGMQQSFLSGVASGALGGGAQQSGSGGKTLLGQ